MRLLDSDIGRSAALVIDPNATSRSILGAMLRDCGVRDVVSANKVIDARRWLESRRFDIVLCEHDFGGDSMTGQDLMADLRLAQVMPLSTVVVMISGESAYSKVAEAAEAALDAYLIKPHTEQALLERLAQARQRKRALSSIIQLIEKGGFVEAAEACQVRYETRGPAWLPAARIGAELWLKIGKPHAAQTMFEAILRHGAMPWAKLGIARSQYETGAVLQSRRTLESLLGEQPGYADAYDIMGRVLLDQGSPEQALDALRRASAITPGCVARLVKFGLLAFYFGPAADAMDALQRAARLGLNSRTYDLQGLVLLATLQFDRNDLRGLSQSLDGLTKAREAQTRSARLRRFEAVVSVFKALLERRVPDAVLLTRDLLQELQWPDFEFEAACNVVAMLARMHRSEVRLDDIEHHLAILARRFAVSHATEQLLCAAALGELLFTHSIREHYAAICGQAEAAVSHTIAGRPREAVVALLADAQHSLNAKLIDLALHTLHRHRGVIEDAVDLERSAMDLHTRFRSYGTQVHLKQC